MRRRMHARVRGRGGLARRAIGGGVPARRRSPPRRRLCQRGRQRGRRRQRVRGRGAQAVGQLRVLGRAREQRGHGGRAHVHCGHTQARQRSEEGQRRGLLLEPLVGVTRITLQMIRYLVQMSPGLTEEIHRLRLARQTASVRSSYLAGQLDKQIKLAQSKYARLRVDVQTKRAMAMWRRIVMNRHFERWKSFARFVIWQRIKVNSVRARRAVRKWYAYKQAQRVAKAKTLLARTHFLRAFSNALFRHWHAYTRTETRTFRAQWARACACDRHSKLTRAFRRLHDHAKTLRTMKHFAARLAMRVLVGWKTAAHMLRDERRAADMQARVNEERRRRALETVHKAEDDQEERRRFEAEAAAFEAFQAEAARLQEEQRLETMRREAERTLHTLALLKAQRSASEENYAKRRAAFRAAFEDEWRARIKAAVFGARAAAEAYCSTSEGRLQMAEDAKKMLMAANVEQVNQEDSTWYAVFDLKDGCIHFIRDADPTADPPLERLDLNFDQMRLDDAVLVASAHYIAKQGVLKRRETLTAKDEDFVRAWRDQCARALALQWRKLQYRRAFLAQRRLEVETHVDAYTGALYYSDVETGAVFDAKPRIFRSQPVHPPEPLWHLKCSAGPPDPETGAETQQWSYQHRKIPWKTSEAPPEHVRMCGVCTTDFATRRCLGEGCDGLLYCYACFLHYHPRDNYDWAEHWRLHQRRVAVEPVSRAEREAEARARAAGESAAELQRQLEAAEHAERTRTAAFQKERAQKAAALEAEMAAVGTGATAAGGGAAGARARGRAAARGAAGSSRSSAPGSRSPDGDRSSRGGSAKGSAKGSTGKSGGGGASSSSSGKGSSASGGTKQWAR